MADAAVATVNKPAWVDLASKDAAASHAFYAKVFGWQVDVNPDPQYGGYGLARIGGKDVAGIGPTQSPDQPSAWSVYIGTDDAEDLAKRVQAAGGTVVAPPFDVGDQGRMAVFQDPSGAFISAWQATHMGGFQTHGPNAFSWAELNSRDLDRAKSFYEQVFGWTAKAMDAPEGAPPYTEFQTGDHDIAGGMDMPAMVPEHIPSYWLVYFGVDDIEAAHRAALDAGATSLMAPEAYPGGRYAVLSDPQGAAFGLMESHER